MVVSINSKTCKDGTIQFPTSMSSLRRKKIWKNCGQIGVKGLLSDNDAILFSYNNSLGKECFHGGKTDTRGSPNWTECSWRELFLQDSSTSKLLAPEFSHTAPRTFSQWPPASTTQQLFHPSVCMLWARGTMRKTQERRQTAVPPEEAVATEENPAPLGKYQHNVNDIQTWIFSSFVAFNVSIKVINRLLWWI